MSVLLQLHLHSSRNTWLQYIAQRQLQVKINILVLVFGVTYIRDFTLDYLWMHSLHFLGYNILNWQPDCEFYINICIYVCFYRSLITMMSHEPGDATNY